MNLMRQQSFVVKRKGAYLRRGRGCREPLPHVLYLAEVSKKAKRNTPEYFYHFESQDSGDVEV